MPRLTLPGGTNVLLGVFHETGELNHSKQKRRQTRVALSILKGVPEPGVKAEVKETVTVRSITHEKDIFCPFKGRYFAARQLVKTDLCRKLSKEDRHLLMKTIVPELFTNKEQRERKVYEKLHRKYGPKVADIKVAAV
jgi:hypothetical protein